MHVELGACSSVTNNCDRLEFAVTVPAQADTAPVKCGG
jgi:hypothetical protein